MNFFTSLPILTNCKDEHYDSTLVIIDYLIKMVYYELVKIRIDIFGLAKVIIYVVIHTTAFSSQLSQIKALYINQSFALHCATSQESGRGYL